MANASPFQPRRTCSREIAPGQLCKRKISEKEKFCWQHANGLRHKLRALPRNQTILFWLAVIGFPVAVLGAYWSYMGARRIWPPSLSQSNPPGDETPVAAPHKPLPPISKASGFSTIVPVIAKQQPERPVRAIPIDENFRDPRRNFYDDLSMLSAYPFVSPPGVTFPERHLGNADEARAFLARLMQYYLLHEIRELQHGSSGIIITKFLGQEKGELGAVDVPPVEVPDPVPYPVADLFRALRGNEFLDVYSYSESAKDGKPPGPPGTGTPHWDQLEKTFWKDDRHPFVVPRGTTIDLLGDEADRGVRLERRGFYQLKFTVTCTFGGSESVPENFYTHEQDVDSYDCRITMNYRIQQQFDDGFAPSRYARWADDLFAGMKTVMAP